MELIFKALFLCVVFLVFFLLAYGLSKLVDMFINFWTSGE